jgi:hypothetical protein
MGLAPRSVEALVDLSIWRAHAPPGPLRRYASI